MPKPIVVNLEQPIVIRPYPNGGWTIEQNPADLRCANAKLGAYGSAEEALAALRQALVSPQGGVSEETRQAIREAQAKVKAP